MVNGAVRYFRLKKTSHSLSNLKKRRVIRLLSKLPLNPGEPKVGAVLHLLREMRLLSKCRW